MVGRFYVFKVESTEVEKDNDTLMNEIIEAYGDKTQGITEENSVASEVESVNEQTTETTTKNENETSNIENESKSPF